MKKKQLIDHMKKFSTFEWLTFIKKLENTTDEEFKKVIKKEFDLHSIKNANWYILIIDLALRMSKYKQNIVKFQDLPSYKDYTNFIQLYVNSEDSEQFSINLNHSLALGLSKLTYEQLKLYAPMYHGMGRLLILYTFIEDKIKNNFGLSPRQIVIFFMYNNGKHTIYQPFSLEVMCKNLQKIDNSFTCKKLQKFLDAFSLTIKEYRMKAKEMGITKNTIKSKRLIFTYPIISLENNHYFIPSIYILEEGLSYKIFETLDGLQRKSQVFRKDFGIDFENYIRQLTKTSHNEYFYECDFLIKDETQRRAEFYLVKDDISIVIEAKLLHIDEDIILYGSSQKLEWKFEKKIKDALAQIESCFNELNTKYHYGIIVIHTHIPMLESYLKSFKFTKKYEWIDNIIIMSIVDYEVMVHNPFQKIVQYFQEKEEDSKQVALYFEQTNQYLLDNCNNLIDELVEENKEDN